MKLRPLSFRTKMIVFVEAVAIALNVVIAFFVWKELDEKVREITREKLVTIASTTAQLIDAKSLGKIREESGEESKSFEKVHEFLKNVMAANPETDDIYTFRRTEKEGVWAYIVGGYEEEDKNSDGTIEEDEEPVGIGEEFDPTQYPPEIMESFERPIAEREINCDKWGCWLSGYAPVYDEKGSAVAVAAVDISAQNIVAFEKKAKTAIAAGLLAVFIIYPVILYVLLKILIRPVSAIVAGLKKFSTDLSGRIDIRSRDEFGLIAGTFNQMAGELEELYKNLEEKVREKTKELSSRMKEIEQKSAENEALLGSIGEGMMAFDWMGKAIMLNNRAEMLTGKNENKIVGRKCADIIKLADEKGNQIPEEREPIAGTLRSGKRNVYSGFYLLKPDGAKIPVMITVSPVVMDKKIIGAIAVFRDITREKEIDKAKSEFVSLASHQLLTPLSSVSWYAEMLLEDKAAENRKKRGKYLKKIYGANQRMVELVNSLLNVSRIEMGTFSIETELTDIKKTIESLLDELKPLISEKKIKIIRKYGSNAEKFRADPKLLRIIIQNLLSNAAKYTPEKGMITVSLKKEKNKRGKEQIVIKVADTGYGISPKDRPKIFTKLFRADNIKEKIIEGTGLGLYITKSIVDNSGGSIDFESRERKGTVFSVSFPASGMKERKGTRKLI